jgi:signal peptidase II
MRSWRPWIVFGLIGAAVVLADQASKAWVESGFPLASPAAPPGVADAPTPVIGDLVRIARTWNDGGIFGLFGDSAMVLGLASIAVIGVILWVEATQGVHSPLLTVALGLLIGGAIGNLIDRLRFGHVIDWVDTGLGTLRFYTFNVADSAISIAVVLLLVMGLLGPRLGRLVGATPTVASTDHRLANGGHP